MDRTRSIERKCKLPSKAENKLWRVLPGLRRLAIVEAMHPKRDTAMNGEECERWNTTGYTHEVKKLKKRMRMTWRLGFCAVALVGDVCAGQERCGAEGKLLLSAANILATVATLKAQKKSSGEIYFYDTEKLELFSQGVIVRLRRGVYDLTVKLRPANDKKFSDPAGGVEDFKCEVDLAGDEENTSYSVRRSFSNPHIPATGKEIYQSLSAGQKELLRAAHVQVEWDQVKRVADIKATDWKIKGDSRFKKLTLELWEWPGGKNLELSTKTSGEEVEAGLEYLRRVASGKGLEQSVDQRSKTRMVLEQAASLTVR
jgi:hypothetical protein